MSESFEQYDGRLNEDMAERCDPLCLLEWMGTGEGAKMFMAEIEISEEQKWKFRIC